MVAYQFNFCFEDDYVGMSSRQLGNSIKEHFQKSIDDFCKISNEKNKS